MATECRLHETGSCPKEHWDCVLIAVAPFAPFPLLAERGPMRTWAKHPPDGIQVFTYSGKRPRGLLGRLHDLRESLRLLGVSPSQRGLQFSETPFFQFASRLLLPNTHWRQAQRGIRVVATIWMRLLQAVMLALMLVDRLWPTPHQARVSIVGKHLQANRRATPANHLAITRDCFSVLMTCPSMRGILRVTASTYVDLERFHEWRSRIQDDRGIWTLSQAQNPPDFISGGAIFLTPDVIRQVIRERNFDRAHLDDVALTRWWKEQTEIVLRYLPSASLPPMSSGDAIEDCPMCLDSQLFIVRCTLRLNRREEARRMASLDHDHHTDRKRSDSFPMTRDRGAF